MLFYFNIIIDIVLHPRKYYLSRAAESIRQVVQLTKCLCFLNDDHKKESLSFVWPEEMTEIFRKYNIHLKYALSCQN